jgi:hypothetical protein
MYVTVFSHTVRRRKTGRVETVGVAYRTKRLTPHHAYLRSAFPDAQTWQDPDSVITDFVPGMNLGMRPLVRGGTQVA